jgi:hypothetical protein
MGALCARGAWGAEAVPAGPQVRPGQFVVTVNAGDRKDVAQAVLRRRGGYNPANPEEAAAHLGAGLPA